MLKTLIILFMLSIFLLLIYMVFSPLWRGTPGYTPATLSSKKELPEINRKKPITDRLNKKTNTSTQAKETLIEKMQEAAKNVKKIFSVKPQMPLSEAIAQLGGEIGDPVYLRIFKEEAELEVWMQHGERYHLIQTYPICAYSGDLGPKLREGDRQSPEGFYYVTKSRLNPNSRFHLSFNLGYPNRYDRVHGRTGSFLMVHGDCVSIGCYAMTDEKIEEIYELVEQALEQGQKIVRVHAFPFRMTEANMQRHQGERWYAFWENLKEGYDFFESSNIPPEVGVAGKKYTFY